MAAYLAALPVSLAGGGMLAIRARRHCAGFDDCATLAGLFLPFAFTGDVAILVVLHLAVSVAIRCWQSTRPTKLRRYSGDLEESASLLSNWDEKVAPGSPSSPRLRARSPSPKRGLRSGAYDRYARCLRLGAVSLLGLLSIFALMTWSAGFTVLMFENDSSGLPFDWVHFFEMSSNISEGMRWIPVTSAQVARGLLPVFLCSVSVLALVTSTRSLSHRLRLIVAAVYLVLGLIAQRAMPAAFRSRNVLFDALRGYATYQRAKSLVSTAELPQDATFYGSSNIHSPFVDGVRKPSIAPRHVFHVLLESASAAAFPFSPSFCAHHGCDDADPALLTPSFFTPNYARFLNESFDASAVMSTTSFSNKAHFSAMCGTMQELKDWTSEELRPTTLPCLPELLKSMDDSFVTATFSSGDAYWDKLDQSLKRMGYDSVASKAEVLERGLPCNPLADLMCADDEILPLVEEWIDAQLAAGSRMMMSLVTINLHVEYYSPKEPAQYTKSPRANAYLNSLKWTDEVFGKFLEVLRVRGLLGNSLVVIHGDHADHLSPTPDESMRLGPFEEIYLVPFAFRMPGGSLVARPRPSSRPHSGIDIVPTLLDALSVSPHLIEHYSGRSMLRHPPAPSSVSDHDRLLFTTESPGKTAIMLHDGPLKLARLSSEGYYCAVDRASDPRQESPLCFNIEITRAADGTKQRERTNTLETMPESVKQRLSEWVDEYALPKFEEHIEVNARYWSDAAVKGHEEVHRAFLELARGELEQSEQL